MSERSGSNRQWIERSLVIQFRIFSVLALVFTIVLIVRIANGSVSLLSAIAGLLGGMVVGVILTRARNPRWNEHETMIVKRMNAFGGTMLVWYVLFLFNRTSILRGLFDTSNAATIAALGIAITAGIMLGRVLSMRRSLQYLLQSLEPGTMDRRT